jgi:hypothetical protein
MTFIEIQAAYRRIQGRICELRCMVEDLSEDARALYESASTPEDEAPPYMLHQELEELACILSEWEGEDA